MLRALAETPPGEAIFPALRHLTLAHQASEFGRLFAHEIGFALERVGKDLESLSLQVAVDGDRLAAAVARHCASLQHLDVNLLHADAAGGAALGWSTRISDDLLGGPLTDAGLVDLLRNLPRLQTLRILVTGGSARASWTRKGVLAGLAQAASPHLRRVELWGSVDPAGLPVHTATWGGVVGY
jgi:hypothetical protein